MGKRRRFSVTAGALLAASAAVVATVDDDHQSHASIRAVAERHALVEAERLDGRAEVEVGRLDNRLRLGVCDQPLESFDSPNGLNRGRGVVGVACNGSTPWKIYVPVRLALLDAVVVTRRPVVRGQALTADDLMLDEVDITAQRHGVFRSIEDVVGMRSKRQLDSGDVLSANVLQRPKLVKRGGAVQIIAIGDGLRVSMRGEAMADGGNGDRVRVKNLSTGRVITGTVTRRGVIEVVY
jgi:flagellar basal body P-ring formation protein FlgA